MRFYNRNYIIRYSTTHNSIDVFAVTETWLDSSFKDGEIFPYSFSINIVRNDRIVLRGQTTISAQGVIACSFARALIISNQ